MKPAIMVAGSTTVGLLLALAVLGLGTVLTHHPPREPGPQWLHDHASVYYTCTADGHELLKDADTGAVTIAPNNTRCDTGG